MIFGLATSGFGEERLFARDWDKGAEADISEGAISGPYRMFLLIDRTAKFGHDRLVRCLENIMNGPRASSLRTTRRAFTAGLSSLPFAACSRDRSFSPFPGAVVTFDPAREAELYPEGKPLLALYQSGGSQLGWVAAVHGDDAATAETIRRTFDLVQPRSVILEGFPTEMGPNPARVLAAIREGARNETMLAVEQALNADATVWGGEPTERQRIAALRERGFAAEDILFAAFFGPLEQDQREGRFGDVDEPAFDEAFAVWAVIIASEQGVDDVPTALAFRSWFERTFGKPIEQDAEWWTRGWPGRLGVGSDIARTSNHVRDVHVYELTITRLNEDRHVVVVFGGSHLSSVWSALERSLGTPTIKRFDR